MALFTSNDLLLYLYREASPQQTAAIEAALEHNLALREQLSMIEETLPRAKNLKKPSTQVVSRILAYAAGAPLQKMVQHEQPSA
jgi:hypothetical protein